LAIGIVAAFAAIVPAVASANFVATSATTTYGSDVPGGHGDFDIVLGFDYGAAPVSEDLNDWAIDAPAGLVGNPNSIPVGDRCTKAQFLGAANVLAPVTCPNSSIVGFANVTYALDSNNATALVKSGVIYEVQDPTDPEVPTILGTQFTATTVGNPTCAALGQSAPCTVYPRTKSAISPLTNGDFRLRTIPQQLVSNSAGVHIVSIQQHINAYPGSPQNTTTPYLTNPSTCGPWNSFVYGQAVVSNTNADSDPKQTGTNNYLVSPQGPSNQYVPNCTTRPSFDPGISTTFSTVARDSNPQLDVTVTNPNVPDADIPSKIVSTLPASITTDLQSPALTNLCGAADLAANTCPAASQVGTVSISTPLILPGLTGNVYATTGSTSVLPDLEIFVTGEISFRMHATNKFVGVRGNQIETTFDNLPQQPFSSFTLSLAGGKDTGLLTISKCPSKGGSPEDGPILYDMTGYSGQAKNTSYATSFNGCYGKPTVKSIKKCVTFNLKVKPGNLINPDGIAKVGLYVGKSKKKATKLIVQDKKKPFKFNKRISNKFKKGQKFYFRVRTTYKPTVDQPKGKTIYSKTASAKRCK
jgi:hypothetical protein